MKPRNQRHAWEQDQEKKQVYAKGSRASMQEEEWEREPGGDRKWDHTQFCHSLLVYCFTQLLP